MSAASSPRLLGVVGDDELGGATPVLASNDCFGRDETPIKGRHQPMLSLIPEKAPTVVAWQADASEHRLKSQGSADTFETIAPPGTGELVHPAGFRTNDPPTDRPIRVLADGVFDLFHYGHMRALEQAKKTLPNTILVVGVTGDETTLSRKGVTVMSHRERVEAVRHCKWVDEVIEDCPWVITPDFLKCHKIDYVAHDDLPYAAAEGDDVYRPLKASGNFLVTQRSEGVATTDLITRIIRNYEMYVHRQFTRGTSRKELNIGLFKKNELDIKRHMRGFRDRISSNTRKVTA